MSLYLQRAILTVVGIVWQWEVSPATLKGPAKVINNKVHLCTHPVRIHFAAD